MRNLTGRNVNQLDHDNKDSIRAGIPTWIIRFQGLNCASFVPSPLSPPTSSHQYHSHCHHCHHCHHHLTITRTTPSPSSPHPMFLRKIVSRVQLEGWQYGKELKFKIQTPKLLNPNIPQWKLKIHILANPQAILTQSKMKGPL